MRGNPHIWRGIRALHALISVNRRGSQDERFPDGVSLCHWRARPRPFGLGRR